MSRRAPKVADVLNLWIPMFKWMRMSDRADGRRLGCIINGQGTTYVAIAVETSVTAGVAELLDNHAHKLIGTFPDLATAQAACEAFASEWSPQTTAAAPCPCPELGAGRTKQASSSRRPVRTKQSARAR